VNDESGILCTRGMYDMEELYKNIKKRRLELGMSQDELARKVGYTSRSTIARIEHGEINLPQSKVVDIAKALKVTPSYLMGWEEAIDVENGILLAELTAAQEEFMEHYFEMQPQQQMQMERLAYYVERMEGDKIELLIKIAKGLMEE